MPPLFIADSDDEDDSGYSPPRSPRGVLGVTTLDATAAHSSDHISHATGSTDSAFFQRVFDEQNDSGHEQPLCDIAGGIVPGRSNGGSGEATAAAGLKPTLTGHGVALLTSITDPTADKNRQVSSSRVTNELTQVTTPGRGGTKIDPWDVPSSPEVTNLRKSATSAKTPKLSPKPVPLWDNSNGHDNVLHQDESQTKSRKRKRTERPRHSQDQDEINLVAMPVGEPDAVVHGACALSSNLVPTLPVDSESSLFIVPNGITASQRMQYQSVTLPSSDGPIPNMWLVRNQLNGIEGSSGSATNLNTPRSDDKPYYEVLETEFEPQEPAITDSCEKAKPARQQWSSSPDVISAVAPTAHGRQMGQRTPGEGGTKVLTKHDEAAEDKDAAYRAKAPPDVLQAYDEDESDYSPAPKPERQKRPRGRPKKKTGSDDAPTATNPPVFQLAKNEKKKRGRPRKSMVEEKPEKSPSPALEAVGVAAAEDDQEPNRQDEASREDGGQQYSLCPTSKEVRGNKARRGTLAGEEKEGTGQRGAVPEPTAGRIGPVVQSAAEASPHGQEKAATGSTKAPTGGGSGKPLYRVGLSKRTRIAPLLKMVRK